MLKNMKIKIILLFYSFDIHFINAMNAYSSLKPLNPTIYKQVHQALQDIEQKKIEQEQKLRSSRNKLEENKKLLKEKLNNDSLQ